MPLKRRLSKVFIVRFCRNHVKQKWIATAPSGGCFPSPHYSPDQTDVHLRCSSASGMHSQVKGVFCSCRISHTCRFIEKIYLTRSRKLTESTFQTKYSTLWTFLVLGVFIFRNWPANHRMSVNISGFGNAPYFRSDGKNSFLFCCVDFWHQFLSEILDLKWTSSVYILTLNTLFQI